MTSPVAQMEVVASIRSSAESIARKHEQRAAHLSGMPRPGRMFGLGRKLQSGAKRSSRQVMENGALRSDAPASRRPSVYR